MMVLKNHVVPMLPHEPNRKRKNNTPRGLAAHSTPIIHTIFLKTRVQIYEARVRFGTRVRVRVRMRVRDSAIFEKGGCGCGRTRRLKNY